MKINFKEGKIIEIIRFNKQFVININEIDNINIKFVNFIIIKLYYLNILTKKGEYNSFVFLKKDKENIKREVFYIRNYISYNLE